MTVKTILTAAVLAALPGLAFAQCSDKARLDQQAMSCVEGTMWDATAGTCLPVTTS
jgi:hypothetical protein